jgi:hypothetical protein
LRAARRLTLSLLVAASTATALIAPITVARAAVPPTVAIAAPAGSATVSGLVTISVAGNVDPAETTTARTVLNVDGAPYGLPAPCQAATAAPSCPTAFTWDSTGLNGPHVLQVVLTTPSDPAVVSAPLTVTAVNPAPTVTITSPKPNAVAKGTLTVNATGSVDLSQNDAPVSLQLWVDQVKYGVPVPCTVVVTTAKDCAGTFTVAQPTWSGSHSIQVTMGTTVSTASSAVLPYFAYSASKVVLSRIPWGHAGKLAVVRGQVNAVTSGAPVVGAKVRLTLTPATGKAHAITVGTGLTGHFSLATKIALNTTVTATVLPAPGVGTGRSTTRIGVFAPIACKADRTVRHGGFGSGTCTVAHLPNGTKVTLQYQSKKKWHVLGAGTTVGTSIPVSFKFGTVGSYPVRLVLGANKAYLATYGTPFVVKVT